MAAWDTCESVVRIEGILRNQKADWYMDGTPGARRQWHNLKYYTWVEQQGKMVDELNAQLNPEWWLAPSGSRSRYRPEDTRTKINRD